MANQRQVDGVTDRSERKRPPGAWILAADAVVIMLALGIDLLTDRSFGAVMLSVLPLSMIALACLVVGPWLGGPARRSTLVAWVTGASLVLVLSIAFCLIGPEQARTGELIFTYAAMILALPSSLVLPLAMAGLDPLLGSTVITRIIGTWLVCVGVGGLQWRGVEWAQARLRQRVARRRASRPESGYG